MAGCLAFPTPPKSPPAHAQLLFGAVDAGAGNRTRCGTSTLLCGSGSLPEGFLPAGCSLILSFPPLLPYFFPQLLSPSAGAGVPCRGGLAAGAVNALPPGTGARRGAQGRLLPPRRSSRAFCQSGRIYLLFVTGGKANAECNRRLLPLSPPCPQLRRGPARPLAAPSARGHGAAPPVWQGSPSCPQQGEGGRGFGSGERACARRHVAAGPPFKAARGAGAGRCEAMARGGRSAARPAAAPAPAR